MARRRKAQQDEKPPEKADSGVITKKGDGQSYPARADDAAIAAHEAELLSEVAAGLVYGIMLGLPEDEQVRLGCPARGQLLEEIAPKDPLERMLAEQLAWTHQRLRSLSLIANTARDHDLMYAANDQCDKAMNAYRRGMLALKEYRSRRSQAPQIAIQQVNESGPGNVLVSADPGTNKKNVTNEQGTNCGH